MCKTFWNKIKSMGQSLQSWLLLIVRLYWGYQFFLTGFGKLNNLDRIAAYFQTLGIPFPHFNAFLAGGTEMIGGALLVLGLLSRIATIPLFGVILVAYLTAEFEAVSILFKNLDPAPFFSSTPFLFGYALVIVFCFGPGKFSLDYFLSGAYKNKEMP